MVSPGCTLNSQKPSYSAKDAVYRLTIRWVWNDVINTRCWGHGESELAVDIADSMCAHSLRVNKRQTEGCNVEWYVVLYMHTIVSLFYMVRFLLGQGIIEFLNSVGCFSPDNIYTILKPCECKTLINWQRNLRSFMGVCDCENMRQDEPIKQTHWLYALTYCYLFVVDDVYQYQCIVYDLPAVSAGVGCSPCRTLQLGRDSY